MGFTGYEPIWNESSGMYNGTITPEEDLRQTLLFESLYDRMREAAFDLPAIVLTHTPKHCWSKKPFVSGWTYINGHTHHNSAFENEGARIYSDNQIGYSRELDRIKFKRFTFSFGPDIFEAYEDGIHQITIDQFVDYHHSRAIHCSFNRKEQIHLIKNSGYRMFVYRNSRGNLLVLRSGKASKLESKDINRYYQLLPQYIQSAQSFLKPFSEYQSKVSKAVRSFGGDGRIHG